MTGPHHRPFSGARKLLDRQGPEPAFHTGRSMSDTGVVEPARGAVRRNLDRMGSTLLGPVQSSAFAIAFLSYGLLCVLGVVLANLLLGLFGWAHSLPVQVVTGYAVAFGMVAALRMKQPKSQDGPRS